MANLSPPEHHDVNYGWIGMVISVLFNVPPEVVVSGFVGSIFAVILRQAFTFKNGVMVILGTTFGVTCVLPDITTRFNFTSRAVAFFGCFFAIYLWPAFSGMAQSIIEAVRDAIISRIKTWGGSKESDK